MKKINLLMVLLMVSCFVFAKDKNKNTVKEVKGKVIWKDGGYVISSLDNPKLTIIAIGLPVEYQVEGLEVRAKGVLGKKFNNLMPMDVHFIAVKRDQMELYSIQNPVYHMKFATASMY